MRVTLVAGVNCGITMVAAMPSSLACRATAWAWLPADMAITPRRARPRSAGEPVGRAAFLERAGDLQVVELQQHFRAGQPRDRMARQLGVRRTRPADPLGRTAWTSREA